MLLVKYDHEDIAWIIIPISLLPDIDHLNNVLWDYGIIPWESYVVPNMHIGMLHNVAMVVVIAIVISVVLYGFFKVNIYTAAACCAIGYSAHLCEDYFVYPAVYPIWFPFTTKLYGNQFIPETGDLLIAGSRVLGLGILLLVVAVGLRRYSESIGWINSDAVIIDDDGESK